MAAVAPHVQFATRKRSREAPSNGRHVPVSVGRSATGRGSTAASWLIGALLACPSSARLTATPGETAGRRTRRPRVGRHDPPRAQSACGRRRGRRCVLAADPLPPGSRTSRVRRWRSPSRAPVPNDRAPPGHERRQRPTPTRAPRPKLCDDDVGTRLGAAHQERDTPGGVTPAVLGLCPGEHLTSTPCAERRSADST